jgi:hypothetical protein
MQTKNGETFVSDTDTEVIPKLLKFAYDSMTAEQQQEGSNGTVQVPFPKVRLVHACWHVAYAMVTVDGLLLLQTPDSRGFSAADVDKGEHRFAFLWGRGELLGGTAHPQASCGSQLALLHLPASTHTYSWLHARADA